MRWKVGNRKGVKKIARDFVVDKRDSAGSSTDDINPRPPTTATATGRSAHRHS
jgi:hypothetical protein